MLRRLMLTKGAKRRRGGFISYAQLGINQLGAVYEGLMSYTGFVATEQLYEVAKNGDPKDGSWMIPASKADEYDDNVFVYKEDPYTGVRSRVSYAPGAFVYRLAGRDRQTSASYYTPQSLTEVTVQLALKYRLDQDGTVTPARELLDWTICEPALGSGAFLNEAINQVAAEYLRRRARELKVDLDPEQYHLELQRVKAYIALHNSYGVDLNRTAVELAEVSLWLNVMHAGLQAPWFGLHLQRGNSLIGCGRKAYEPKQLADKSWLTTAPAEKPFRDGPIDEGAIHHFLLPADGWGAVAGEKEARELAPAETAKLKAWRTAMKRVPSAKGKNSQVRRLQALARRVEFLWGLVQQRLAVSEREIRRDIAVWGADDLPPVTGAVARDKILADLTAPGTPYWRLKTLMDAWCALWFWPLDKVGLLDGSDPAAYPAEPVQVSHVQDVPAYEEQVVYETPDIFGNVEPRQMTLPTKATGTRRLTVAEQLRKQVPLTNLDDWLTFAEALVGRSDVDENTERFYGRKLDSLAEMSDFEQKLDGVIGVDSPWLLADRFPWLLAAERIAEQQGFFHWELTFAQAFAKGGFDLQVGNPPWVRPIWLEDVVLAEVDPWFQLGENSNAGLWRSRKSAVLSRKGDVDRYLTERAGISAATAFYGGSATYSVLAGTQPNLYRAFAVRTWANVGWRGVSALIHPDTHFTGAKEGPMRAACYRRMRFHAHFVNQRKQFLFADIDNHVEFGIHVYGSEQEVNFHQAAWLYDPSVLVASFHHDGEGDPPGLRLGDDWDLRPHASRLISVDRSLLEEWRQLSGSTETPLEHAKMLYPVTLAEKGAITALTRARQRSPRRSVLISSGYHEKGAKEAGIIRWEGSDPNLWSEVVLQGPHFGVSSPLAKHPNIPCRSNKDYETWDLTSIGAAAVPRTNYRRSCDIQTYLRAQDFWDGRPCSEYYRLAWRRMVSLTGERSLYAALVPPGPAHVHTVNTLYAGSSRDTALFAGFWAALPLDYLLRVTGRADLQGPEARAMPVPDSSHPLALPLLLRTLRLNCVTDAYADLWSELFDSDWLREDWAYPWPHLVPLGSVQQKWEWATPLRTERERRAAAVEIDALVAVWLGIDAAQLSAIVKSRYSVLAAYEKDMWFDARGRKIAREFHAQGVGQSKDAFKQLVAYLENSKRNAIPDGYRAPFYKADRENEYRQAHAVFSKRLQDAIDAGWRS
ncbi:class I SAM-dependent DNA methyltransferase [Micromonospora aurantiaca]|uniref:class I SAM-dependent DNA methyltransferase n=1 Tax=Micromonospora aurantiaca (nom. illeg.) TaxID=47850 RepID=UPI0037ACDE6E